MFVMYFGTPLAIAGFPTRSTCWRLLEWLPASLPALPRGIMRNASSLAAPLAWAALYFLFGFLSYRVNGAIIVSGYIWLPAGITMAALLLTPTIRWFALLVLLVAAQVMLGWIEQRALWRMLLLAGAEIGVAAVAVWLARRASVLRASMSDWPFVRGLLSVALGASLTSGFLGASWFATTQDLPFWHILRTWSLSELVGMLVMTPLLAAWLPWRAGDLAHPGTHIGRSEFLLGLASFLAMLASAWLVFGSQLDRLVLDIHFSTTYLPLLFIALVALLWRGRGGAVAVFCLALIAFFYHSAGSGPFMELLPLHASNAWLELQVYLAVAALLSLLIGALQGTRDRLQWQLRQTTARAHGHNGHNGRPGRYRR